MNTFNRPELDAKLSAFDARMDARWSSIQADIARFMSSSNENFARIDGRLASIDQRLDGFDKRLDRFDKRLDGVETTFTSLKTTVIVTGITAVFATVFGVAAINATIFSNMVAAFESGKNEAADRAELKRQLDATAILLRQIQDQTDRKQVPRQ